MKSYWWSLFRSHPCRNYSLRGWRCDNELIRANQPTKHRCTGWLPSSSVILLSFTWHWIVFTWWKGHLCLSLSLAPQLTTLQQRLLIWFALQICHTDENFKSKACKVGVYMQSCGWHFSPRCNSRAIHQWNYIEFVVLLLWLTLRWAGQARQITEILIKVKTHPENSPAPPLPFTVQDCRKITL